MDYQYRPCTNGHQVCRYCGALAPLADHSQSFVNQLAPFYLCQFCAVAVIGSNPQDTEAVLRAMCRMNNMLMDKITERSPERDPPPCTPEEFDRESEEIHVALRQATRTFVESQLLETRQSLMKQCARAGVWVRESGASTESKLMLNYLLGKAIAALEILEP